MTWTEVVANPEEVDKRDLPDMETVVDRALCAGAKPPFTYLGSGMTSVVFCDQDNRAFKVGRRKTKRAWEGLRDEYDWLQTAKDVPEVREHVPTDPVWHPECFTIERECVWGRPGTWADSSRLWELHRMVERKMRPHGWNSPEWKEDSWVFPEGGGAPLLVDAGFVVRFGHRLLNFILDVLGKRRQTADTWTDLAWQLRMEHLDGRLTEAEVGLVLEELYRRGAARPD